MPENTTAVVQRFLNSPAYDAHDETAVRELLERAASRLHRLCLNMLWRRYPRLTKPPVYLEAEDMLSGVVEGL